MMFFIYSDLKKSLNEAIYAADHGYVGIVADTRGKRLSTDKIEPYEHEQEDVNSVLDWIVQQPRSNGKVGMYGGSYSGFAQWAAVKHPHPSLTTMFPMLLQYPVSVCPWKTMFF